MRPNYSTNNLDLKIDNPENNPRDTASHIQWNPFMQSYFGVSSWDCTFRVYEVKNTRNFTQVFKVDLDEPITTFEFQNQQYAFLGTMTGNIYALDLQTGQVQNVGCLKEPVLKLAWVKEKDILVAFETGKLISVIDVHKGQSAELQLEEEAVAVDYKNSLFAVGCANNKFGLFNSSHMQQNDMTLSNSPLNSKISCVDIHENGTYVLIGGYDGRVTNALIMGRGYQKEIKSELLFKAYADKNSNQVTDLYPITRCEYGYSSGTKMFYTVSSNGILKNWEYQSRQLISDYPYPSSISAASYNKTNQMIAMGLGYDWSLGVWGLGNVKEPTEIVIKQLNKSDFVSGN